jgi:hypothetical protein
LRERELLGDLGGPSHGLGLGARRCLGDLRRQRSKHLDNGTVHATL